MPTKPKHVDRTNALQSAISACGDEPVIVVWIRHRPRVTTLRPVAQQLAANGFRVVIAYSDSLQASPQTMGFDDDMPCFQVPPEQMPRVTGATIFLTSEQDVQNAPPDARRVGIQHSLPDTNLRRNHAHMLAMNPVNMAGLDYYAIPSHETDENWTIENFRPHVDRLLTAPLIAGRRPSLAVIPFGYPKIDRMMAVDTRDDRLDTITYAPTQSILDYSSVRQKGEAILATLLKDFPAYRVTFRPYPGADVERTRAVYGRFLDDPRFTLDDSPTGEAELRRTALMVSDQSSVAVSFGLGYARPVIFYKSNPHRALKQKGMNRFEPIGLRVTSIDTLKEGVRQLLQDAPEIRNRIEARRGAFIYNPGRSIDYLVEIMPDIIAGNSRPEWLEIPRRPFRATTRAAYRAQYKHIIETVAARHRRGVTRTERVLGPGFVHPAERLVRSTAGRILRRMPGLRRYLSRPKDRS